MGLILRLFISIAAASALVLAVLMLVVWLSRINVPQDFSNSRLEPADAESERNTSSRIDCQGYAEAIRLGFVEGNLPAELYCSKTVAELLAAEEKYDGTLVSIDGEFGAPFEGSYVSDTTSQARLSLRLVDNQFEDRCRLVGRVRGVFRRGPSGQLGVYDGEIQVMEIENLDDSRAYFCGLSGPSLRPPGPTLE
jgi:hypothetical protein